MAGYPPPVGSTGYPPPVAPAGHPPSAAPAANPPPAASPAGYPPPAGSPEAADPNAAFRARLLRYYNKYAPDKIGNLDSLMGQWIGKEEELFRQLVTAYGPEPPADGASPAPAPQPAFASEPAHGGVGVGGASASVAHAGSSVPPQVSSAEAAERCTMPPCPVHPSLAEHISKEKQYAPVFLRAVEAQTASGGILKSGHRADRLFAVTPSTVMLLDRKGNVKKYYKHSDVQSMTVQPAPGGKEWQVLLQTGSKPDVLMYLVQDKVNMEGTEQPAQLVDAMKRVHREVIGRELPCIIKPDPGDLKKEADLKKPEGYEKPGTRIAKGRQQSPRQSLPPSPSPAASTGVMMPGTMTLPPPAPAPAPAPYVPPVYVPPVQPAAPEPPAVPPAAPEPAPEPEGDVPEGSARFPPEDVPPSLWVVCPDRPEAEGRYEWDGKQHGGAPVWEGADGSRLYSEKRDRWAIGTDEGMRSNSGWVMGAASHKGALPHQCDGRGWSVYSDDGGWRRAAAVHVCDSEEQAEGFQLQALVQRQHHLIGDLCGRGRDLRDENRRLLDALQSVPAGVEGLPALRQRLERLEQSAADEGMAQSALLAPRSGADKPFSPLEVVELRKVSYRQQGRLSDISEHCAMLEHANEQLIGLVAAVARGDDPATLPPVSVHSSPARARGAAVARGVEGAAAAAGTGTGAKSVHDELAWAGTLLAKQLQQTGDSELKMTAKAHVVTSNGQVLAPCGVAVTDKALYLCRLVDGRIHHRQPLRDVRRITRFRDRRWISVDLPPTEMYLQLEAEAELLRQLRAAAPSARSDERILNDHVTDIPLRDAFGLDSPEIEQLRREAEHLRAEVERWQAVLHAERVRAQQELEAERLRAEEEAGCERARRDGDERVVRLRVQLHYSEGQEQEWRRAHERSETEARHAMLLALARAAALEGGRWGEWARQAAADERSQLVLACASTVERGKRADIERREAEDRLQAMDSVALRLGVSQSFARLAGCENEGRQQLLAAHAAGVEEAVRPHAAWMAQALTASLLEASSLRSTVQAAHQELAALREKAGDAERGLHDETNRTGAMLRANKVLRQALDACRFTDLCRVQLDAVQLRERASRALTERDAERDVHRLALSLCARLVGCGAQQSASGCEGARKHAGAADAEAEAMLRGGPMARTDTAARTLSAYCRRVAVQLPRLQRDLKLRWDAAHRALATASKGISGAYMETALLDDEFGPGFAEALRGGYPSCEGWMHAADSAAPGANWRRRYFSFEHGALSYQTPAMTRPKTVVTIDCIVAAAAEPSGPSAPDGPDARERPNGRYGSFMWAVETSSGERLRFSCPSQQERLMWVTNVGEAITQFSRNTGCDVRRLPRGKVLPPPVPTSPRARGRSVSAVTPPQVSGAADADHRSLTPPDSLGRRPGRAPRLQPAPWEMRSVDMSPSPAPPLSGGLAPVPAPYWCGSSSVPPTVAPSRPCAAAPPAADPVFAAATPPRPRPSLTPQTSVADADIRVDPDLI